jgi:hypothetical protein
MLARPHHEDGNAVEQPLNDPPGAGGQRPVGKPVEQMERHRHRPPPEIQGDEAVVHDALPAGEKGTRWAESAEQRVERDENHEQADETHLRIVGSDQREAGAADEERDTDQQHQRI